MQISVLQRVERRRRRRRRRGPLVVFVLAVALGLAAFGAHELKGGSRVRSQPAKHKAPASAPTRHRYRTALSAPPPVSEPPLPLLDARSPVSERAFRPHLTAASSIL